jgi:hypothetical protein
MLFDLTFPCYLTTFSGKKCLSGKVICALFVPLIEVLLYSGRQIDLRFSLCSQVVDEKTVLDGLIQSLKKRETSGR